MPHPLNTPVLFIIFNRPNYTKDVFEKIRNAKPRQLFIAADGPRASKPNEIQLCKKTRRIVENIDWDCELKTLYRDKNLGCGRGVSSAITWFFEHVEEGIILEDDCVPDESFFPFCEIMLEKYRNTEGVMQITGTNYHFDTFINQNNSYYFSALNPIWGWATWRKAWKTFSFDMFDIEHVEAILSERILSPEFKAWLLLIYKKTATGEIDTWDSVWNFHFNKNQGICVTPNVNLIKNIGENGVHFKGLKNPVLNMPAMPFSISNLIHPLSIDIDFSKDRLTYHNMLNLKLKLSDRILNKITWIKKRIEAYFIGL
jgi:hypothetical protein